MMVLSDFLSSLHQLRNQVDACMTQGIPADQFAQWADWCIKTYNDVSNEVNVTPHFNQNAEVQKVLSEVESRIFWLNLKR